MRRVSIRKLIAKTYLILLLIWGVASFFLFSGSVISSWPILVLALFALFFIIYNTATQFLLVFISFLLLYAIYGFQFTYNFPIWIAVLMLIFFPALLFLFLYYRCQEVTDYFPLYLSVFVLINIETYLTLSFWLVNPLSRSFIAALSIYIFSGYLESREGGETNTSKFGGYLFTGAVLLVILLLTSSWGR